MSQKIYRVTIELYHYEINKNKGQPYFKTTVKYAEIIYEWACCRGLEFLHRKNQELMFFEIEFVDEVERYFGREHNQPILALRYFTKMNMALVNLQIAQ